MSRLLSLADWLNTAPAGTIAYTANSSVSKSDLESRILHWINVLPAKRGQRWALYHQDSAEFLAMLLALWQLGCTACVPGDDRPATRERLRLQVQGFVADFLDDVVHSKQGSAADNDGARIAWQTLSKDFPALEIYTSGSTGEPKAIQKTVAQLDSELMALEALWPTDHEAVVISTATHQHFYGLIFRLLWPLARGQRFETEQWQYTEDLFSRGLRYPSFALVSTPSHLGRFNTAVAWAEVADRCCSVLSSAAPLKQKDSVQVAQLLQAPVREIYGSSETGAIAWRQQSNSGDEPWQALPGVQLSQTDNALLLVTADQLAGNAFEMSDQVEFIAEGLFHLRGRVDRIVKVEGKRVSLTEVERIVQQSNLVEQAKALTLNRKRVEVALVIELTEAGEQLLSLSGKRKLQQQLKQHLQNFFEPVLLPRRWRFVQQMPYNAQGKLPMDNLQAMFISQEVKWPDLTSQVMTGNCAELVCQIPANLIYFDGHFAGNPILPGIVQVHWAEHYGRQLLSLVGRFDRLEVVKFQQVIFPESTINLTLEYQPEKGKLNFRFYSDKGVHSSGRICFS
ncbi:AMP-binding protein [Amphritea sp. 2_MG-2023]|uniref:AMP-binding protein n=1 Tax=Amphritea TaxID=515417 RepID=UPI001C0699CB|nr:MULTISPECIES: AMP-binding protein [Amphritea]MBU2967482.1 AMP-binding protein [Amphritea atlantica]MDO6418263.1 AMP-binding protein [Amphritea sp. 2_MG-2023]